MKRFAILSLVAAIFCLLGVGLAFAVQGKVVVDPNNRPLGYHSPTPGSAVCTTTTTTKGAIATISSTAGYSTLRWAASDSANAAKRVRVFLNSNTAYMPGTDGIIGLNSGISSVAFKPYSGASAAYTVCYDLQAGGKTP